MKKLTEHASSTATEYSVVSFISSRRLQDTGLDLDSMPQKPVRELVFVKSEFVFRGSISPADDSAC